MELPTPRQLQRFLLTHRGSITFVALALCLWSLASGFHRGTPVIMSAHDLQVGHFIAPSDLYLVYVDGARHDYLDALDAAAGKIVSTDIRAGTPLTAEMLSYQRTDTGFVSLSVSLDEADPANYAPGAHVHVWKLTEDFAELVSTEARVIRANRSRIGAHSVTLRVPRADESVVAQANAVRLVSVS